MRPSVGLAWMALSGILFVLVTACVKVMQGSLPAAQAAFLRYFLGLIFILPLWHVWRQTTLSRRDWTAYAARGICHSVGVTLWFYAMARLPIADVTALNYLQPIYVAVGAAFFLGEKLAFRRIAAIIAALCGAMIILRPGFREIGPGHLAMLATAVFFAASYLMAKSMSNRHDPGMVVIMLSIWVPVGLLPMAIPVWVAPSWTDLGILSLVAIFATLGHYTMTLAFKAAPVSVTQPATFLQLIWSVLLGVFVFDEEADLYVIMGGTLIVLAVCFISFREAQLRKRSATMPKAGAISEKQKADAG